MAIVNSTDTTNSIMDLYGQAEKSTAKTTGSNLGKDAFLTLMITQLQYQDPLNPSSDKDFLAQMAQFSGLEQMQNLNQSSSMSQAYSLIGKVVQATVTDETTLESKAVEGFVDSVSLKNGKTYVQVNGNDIELEKVTNVSYIDYEAANLSNTTKTNAFSLIGKIVKGTIIDATTLVSETVEGFADSVSIKNGKTYVQVNGKNVEFGNITDVSYVDYDSSNLDYAKQTNDTLKTIQEQLMALTTKFGLTTTTETTEE